MKHLIHNLKFYCTSPKMTTINTKRKHKQTTSLWTLGDGLVQQKLISVFGWNVDGYMTVIKNQRIDKIMDYKPDFLCLNETKIDFQKYKKLKFQVKHPFQNYHAYWNFCKISKGYSGVCIFTYFKPIRVLEDFPESESLSLQGRLITLQYDKFFILCVNKPRILEYPQRLQYRIQFDRLFNDYLKNLMLKKPIIVYGNLDMSYQTIDLKYKNQLKNPPFNNPFPQLKQLQINKQFRQTCIQPFSQLYNIPENINNKKPRKRFDYILTDARLKLVGSNIYENYHSLRYPISSLIQIQ